MLKWAGKPIVLNGLFILHLFTVFAVATGAIDRSWIIPLAILVSLYALLADLPSAVGYFIRAVPIFVAIPITAGFDNFNLWRIFSGIIFLRWLVGQRADLVTKAGEIIQAPWQAVKKYPLLTAYAGFILMSVLSLAVASDLFIGIKRIVFILNLSLIGPVIFSLIKEKKLALEAVCRDIIYAGLITVVVGVLQLISTYLVDFETFMEFWAHTVQRGFYGVEWSSIAYYSNTWFAYLSDQLSLRVFSTLPDSHSFPVLLLFSLPALFTMAVYPVLQKTMAKGFWKIYPVRGSENNMPSNGMCKTRGNLLMALIPVFYLMLILSGTRGIWLASLAPLLVAPFIIKYAQTIQNRNIFKYLLSFCLIFFILFVVAWPIFSSNQFQIYKNGGDELFKKRIHSILDLNEISNHGRILIWKATARSIIHHPLLGVGIGNFPTVLGQNQALSKAGSSAHNLYLHLAAETGILGLLFGLGGLLLVLYGGWVVFRDSDDYRAKLYGLAFSLYFLWILAYLMTDAVLFDERAFLLFAINAGVIWALKNKSGIPFIGAE